MAWNDSFKKNSSVRFFQTLGLSLLASSSLIAQEMSSQEAFLLRKISEYWKEGDLNIAKSQILQFLDKYPQSQAKDMLIQLLGDLYLKDNDHSKALRLYSEIKDDKIAKKASFNKAICFYELKMHQELIDHASIMLAQPQKDEHYETVELFLAEAFLKLGLEEKDVEKQKTHFQSALPLFENLTKTKYSERALLPSAELSMKLGKNAEACKYYQELLEKTPEDRESILYKMGCLQAEYKPREAIKTFASVYKLRGKMASDAALLQLQLLFKEQKFKDLLLYQEEAIKHISSEKVHLAEYWIGKSLFHLDDFTEAEKHLQKGYKEDSLNPTEKKSLLKTLLVCSSRTKNLALMESSIQRWEALSPDDKEIADAYVMKYQMLQNIDKASASLALETLLTRYPDHKEKESFLFNLAMIKYKLSQWQEAASALQLYIDTYPNAKQIDICLKQHINCMIEQIKLQPNSQTLETKNNLSQSIEYALAKNIFSNDEKKKIQFTHCNLLIELNKYSEAAVKLNDYIRENPRADNLLNAHLLLTKVYEDSDNDIDLYIMNLERVISLSPKDEANGLYHLKLFNAFLKKSSTSQENEKSALFAKAADQLFICYKYETPIRKDNLAWLCNYYYEKSKAQNGQSNSSEDVQALSKARLLFENLLAIDSYPPTIDLSKEPAKMEVEILKLSELLGWQGKTVERIDLLEYLVYNQQELADLNWKYPTKALLELARAYKESGKEQEALTTYGKIISSSEYALSYNASQAILESSLITYNQLKGQKGNIESVEYTEILDRLKELQIKKKIYQEPLHLEAAFTYVDIKSQLSIDSDKSRKKLLLMQNLKESFSSTSDPLTLEYLSLSSSYLDKVELLSAYMTLADYKIAKLKKETASSRIDVKEAKAAIASLEKEMKELQKDPKLPKELKQRITTSLEAK